MVMEPLPKKMEHFILGSVIALMLACNLPIIDREESSEIVLLTQAAQLSNMPPAQRTQDVASLTQLNGNHHYQAYLPANSVVQPDCNPNYPVGDNLPLTYQFQAGANGPAEDTITLTDASGNRTYHRTAWEQDNLFCSQQSAVSNKIECIVIFKDGFRLEVRDSTYEHTCFTQVYQDLGNNPALPPMPDLAGEPPLSSADEMSLEECNAIPDIQIQVQLIEDVHNQAGTGESEEELYCEYAVYASNSTNRNVHPFALIEQLSESGSTSQWMGLPVIAPGETYNHISQVHQYPYSVSAQKSYTVDRFFGAIYDEPGCQYIRQDAALMQRLSLPVIPPCMSIFP